MKTFFYLISILSLYACNKEKKIETFYTNGSIKESYFKLNDKISGIYKTYYTNGNLESKVEYVDGIANGVYNSFYSNNQLKKVYKIVNGLGEGVFLQYDSLGHLQKKGKYINGKICGIYRKYSSTSEVSDLILLYYDKIIDRTSADFKNNNFSSKNFLDIEYLDTVTNKSFEAKIFIRNCTYNKLTFYEGTIDTTRYFDIKDTLNVFEQINDSMVIYKTNKIKKGMNYWSGILYAKKVTKDTTLYYPYPVLEQFYVK